MRNALFESLESRALFSVTVGAISPEPLVPIVVPVTTASAVSTPLSLNGTIKGTYRVSHKNPDAGNTYSFNGTGSVGPLTHATLFGSVQLPGFVATGHASGRLTIYDSHGAVYVQVTGPTEKGFGPFPGKLSYTITGGTGAYKHASGKGTITDTLTPSATAAGSSHFTFVFHSA